MGSKFQWMATFAILLISYLSYQILLGEKGYFERRQLKLELAKVQFEVDRLEEEKKNLLERKKMSSVDSILLEKEARRYYFLRKDSQILKFKEQDGSNLREEKEPQELWNQIKESRLEKGKIPPLDVLRVFHISFSLFLCIGVFWKLRPKRMEE
ncbi:MAG: septum formation initiator family protein [Leptospira sp.]|nr:septum formation initiator family protein [Leptospira sp.]NCS95514.1 septum formation initiator family protein [Leptospira sp.]